MFATMSFDNLLEVPSVGFVLRCTRYKLQLPYLTEEFVGKYQNHCETERDSSFSCILCVITFTCDFFFFFCPSPLSIPAGPGASVPEGLQRGGIMRGRSRLLPVQRIRVVSRGQAEPKHEHVP